MNFHDIKAGDTVYFFRNSIYTAKKGTVSGPAVVSEVTRKFIVVGNDKYLRENGTMVSNQLFEGSLFFTQKELSDFLAYADAKDKVMKVSGYKLTDLPMDELLTVVEILERNKII